MSTTGLRNGMQDTVAGVTTRSRKRLRDEADASSPAGDLHDRKKRKPHPTSFPLRRSPRHAAKAASTAERDNIPTRHPEPAIETYPISPTASVIDEDTDIDPDSILLEDERPSDPDSPTAEYHISSDALASASSLLIPQKGEIIDLTDSRTERKRKWSTATADDESKGPAPDDGVQRVTRSSSKKAKLDGHGCETLVDESSAALGSYASPTMEKDGIVEEAPLTTNEPLDIAAPILSSSETEACVAEEKPQILQVDFPAPPQYTEPLDELVEDTIFPDATAIDDAAELEHHASGLIPSANSPSDGADRPGEHPAPICVTEKGCDDSSTSPLQQHVVACEPLHESELGPTSDEFGEMESTNTSSVASASSSSGQSIDCARSQTKSCRYFGVDGRFWRSRKPPSSYLAPNPVRRAPRSPTVRRDECRYLPHATERAGLHTFAQTRRQFPRWMQRPSHIYFRGSEFFPRGRPVTEQDMAIDEIGVGIDVDNMLATSTTRDIFEFCRSTSNNLVPQVELDPDLDPSSLLNGQSSFYAHGAVVDCLESGPGQPAVQFTSLSVGTIQPQFWPNPSPSEPFASGLALAGPLNGLPPDFQRSDSTIPSSNAQGHSQELPWDPPSWMNTPQFSLFGIPPLPLPAQKMSLDSSLSAMATYLVNDALPLKSNVDSTTLNLIDGISPTSSSWQPVLAAHPVAQQTNGNSSADGYQLSPLN